MRFDTILIANRGEIALRIIRTARRMGLRTVAVFTDADRAAPHVTAADRALRIGAGPVTESYLSAKRILTAAHDGGAQAIHPGYGFLSESAAFAEQVAQAGLTLIGPSPEAMRVMGDKAAARALMLEHGVPCLPGYEGGDQSDAALSAAAEQIGYPVMVKAAAGGGGRGMRLVEAGDDLIAALNLARSEAQSAFGSDILILERALADPRHVEFQIMADSHGTVLHLGERDCSVQRRHQKIIEESPCPVLTEEQRVAMGAAAIMAARSVEYVGAGTVEFLLDRNGAFYFLEMNTRLQVEHPVTECVTGIDLVELQIKVAQGDQLPLSQGDVAIAGHAIEARLYAEDPGNDFLPATGLVHRWQPASREGVRIDAGLSERQEISPHYDSMLAKIIAHGPDRATALARLMCAIERTVLLGVESNAGFLADVLAQPEFVSGQATTGLLARTYPGGFTPVPAKPVDAALAAALLLQQRRDGFSAQAGGIDAEQLGWSSTPLHAVRLDLSCREQRVTLDVTAQGPGWHVSVASEAFAIHLSSGETAMHAEINGCRQEVQAHVMHDRVFLHTRHGQVIFEDVTVTATAAAQAADGRVVAPMPGIVRAVEVAQGDQVSPGDTLAILEAMKMQHRITASVAGEVAQVHVAPGQQVDAGSAIVEINSD